MAKQTEAAMEDAKDFKEAWKAYKNTTEFSNLRVSTKSKLSALLTMEILYGGLLGLDGKLKKRYNNMKHSKVFFREDGSRVCVEAAIWVGFNKQEFGYTHSVTESKPGRRKFEPAPYAATIAEVFEVKLELWFQINPHYEKRT